MISMKKIIIFVSLVSICFCEENSQSVERGHHHKYEYLTKLAYLVFLGLKVKAVLIVGSVWGIALIFAKIFALFKYLEYLKVRDGVIGHSEKIVYSNPHESSFYDSPAIYGKSHEPSYQPEITFDHPPTSENVEYPPSDFPDVGNDFAGPYDSPVHARSEGNGINQHYVNIFARAIKMMNTTDIAFNIMRLKSEECKKKFVCETEFNIKQSTLLATAIDLLSDETYQKYKGNHTLTDINDCSKLYPNCYSEPETAEI